MSQCWVKPVLVEEKENTLVIRLDEKGNCIARIDSVLEIPFKTKLDSMERVIERGLKLLKKALRGRKVTKIDGQELF